MIIARAPAKLIISGEHSVLHAQPALAMAVNRYSSVQIDEVNCQQSLQNKNSLVDNIYFEYPELSFSKAVSLDSLCELRVQVDKNYIKFLDGKLEISQVLKSPFELLQVLCAKLIELIKVPSHKNLKITTNSNIPIGSGMGSSAAAIISTLLALDNFFALSWDKQQLLSFARKVENLQHGKSSGLDLHLVTHGGCVHFQNDQVQSRTISNMPWFIVNTGRPESNTGECVAQTTKYFLNDPGLASAFGAVTISIDSELQKQNLAGLQAAVRENHKLLSKISVVPEKVQSFIAEIEQHGAAAKISGAGAAYGEKAGVLLLLAEPDILPTIQVIIDKYSYRLDKLEVDQDGARLL